MRRHRTTARGVLLLSLLLALPAGRAAARPNLPPEPPPGAPAAKPVPAPKPAPVTAGIVFPVVGPVNYTDDFGDPRPGGPHQGNDIMAEKRQLAVAAEAGKVKFWTTSANAGCMLYLYGRSGTMYLYIHLNNDVTQGNDNRGGCVPGRAYAKGLATGDAVQAGQPVGYVGDSGDADGIHPHLHFEVHPGGNKAVDPYPYLRRARRLLFAATPETLVSLSLQGSFVSAAEQQLDVRVDSLRVSTGLRVAKVGRTVRLDLPPSALIELKGGIPVANARLYGARKGEFLTAWTIPDWVTLDAQLGKPGVLSAARVALER
jgi:hypothetical protein